MNAGSLAGVLHRSWPDSDQLNVNRLAASYAFRPDMHKKKLLTAQSYITPCAPMQLCQWVVLHPEKEVQVLEAFLRYEDSCSLALGQASAALMGLLAMSQATLSVQI